MMHVSRESGGGIEAKMGAVSIFRRQRLATIGQKRTRSGFASSAELLGGPIARTRERVASDQACLSRTLVALQDVLRSMDPDRRRAAIQGLTPHMRMSLLANMEKSAMGPESAAAVGTCATPQASRRMGPMTTLGHGATKAVVLAAPQKAVARQFRPAARRLVRALTARALPARVRSSRAFGSQLTAQSLRSLEPVVAATAGAEQWFMADEYRKSWQCLCMEDASLLN